MHARLNPLILTHSACPLSAGASLVAAASVALRQRQRRRAAWPKARITLRLENPQPVETGKKIEVIEFFSYGCPHCGELEPHPAGWLKSCRRMSSSAASR